MGRRGRSVVLQAVLLAALLNAVAFVIAGIVPGSSGRLRHAAVGWIAVEVPATAACSSSPFTPGTARRRSA